MRLSNSEVAEYELLPAYLQALFEVSLKADVLGRPVRSPSAPLKDGVEDSLNCQFRGYDLNGSGYLDKDEVIYMMQRLGFKTDEAYVENIMETFANDHSGVIGLAEFEELYAFLVCRLPLPNPM